MRLYHGSTVVVKRPNIQKGRKATDFGRGFYTTTNFEQAKNGLCSKRTGNKAIGQLSRSMKRLIISLKENLLFSISQAQQRNGWSLLSTTVKEKVQKNMSW